MKILTHALYIGTILGIGLFVANNTTRIHTNEQNIVTESKETTTPECITPAEINKFINEHEQNILNIR